MAIVNLIKLTSKSNCHRSKESHLGLGLGPGSYLAASILLPSCPLQVTQSHECSSSTQVSLAMPILSHGCSSFRSSLGRQLPSL